ncbi:MAG TPA: site-specific integrase [Polyangiaceae bacterium]|nr:site-specific integrase [Polyangiaceae bacterium]
MYSKISLRACSRVSKVRSRKVTRPALHATNTVSKRLRWHDLRATGLTWLAVEGASPTIIRDVAGHTQTSMTDRYMRSAAVLRGGRFGQPFPAVPASLIGRLAQREQKERRFQ